MGNLMRKIEGYKTYITTALGMIVVVVGHFWGPIHLGTVDVSVVDSGTMFKVLWAGFVFIFMRHGISNSAALPVAGVSSDASKSL